jgi:hypothetical protein
MTNENKPIGKESKPRAKWMHQQMFTYLLALRDSGVTNMFGASPYLVDEFGLEMQDAHKVCSVWMSECCAGIDTDDVSVDKNMYQEFLTEIKEG